MNSYQKFQSYVSYKKLTSLPKIHILKGQKLIFDTNERQRPENTAALISDEAILKTIDFTSPISHIHRERETHTQTQARARSVYIY